MTRHNTTQPYRGRHPHTLRATPQQRRTVIHRAGGRCQHCGNYCARGGHIDHIKNLAEGGTTHTSNLQLLCQQCHEIKTRRESIRGNREYLKQARHTETHPFETL